MNSRQRVMATLNHIEPDMVLIDIGDYITEIHMHAYRNLLNYLEIEDKNLGFNNFVG